MNASGGLYVTRVTRLQSQAHASMRRELQCNYPCLLATVDFGCTCRGSTRNYLNAKGSTRSMLREHPKLSKCNHCTAPNRRLQIRYTIVYSQQASLSPGRASFPGIASPMEPEKLFNLSWPSLQQ